MIHMTRRAKLQVALESGIDAAQVLREFTENGGSGIDAAVAELYRASQETPVSTLTRRAKLQEALDSLSQEEAAEIVSEKGGLDAAIERLFAAV